MGKSLKVVNVWPIFVTYVHVVAIVREGCGVIGGVKSIILDLWCRLPWYVSVGEGLGDFCKVRVKSNLRS